MIIPYRVDVPMRRWPIANFVIIGITTVVYFLEDSMSEDMILNLALTGWSPLGLIGHILLHADILHLFGNMLFLWVFGNAICAKIGNIYYPLVYVGLGAAAGIVHLLTDGNPMIGASGAINGIIGVFFVWYLLNTVSCLWFLYIRGGSFSISSYWMILLWLVFDIWGSVSSKEPVAYYAHLGGFSAGFLLAVVLLKLKWITMDPTERSLLDIFWGKEPAPPKEYSTHQALQRPSPQAVTEQKPALTPVSDPPQDVVRFICPTCKKSLKVPARYAGEEGPCPSCSTTIRVPKE